MPFNEVLTVELVGLGRFKGIIINKCCLCGTDFLLLILLLLDNFSSRFLFIVEKWKSSSIISFFEICPLMGAGSGS